MPIEKQFSYPFEIKPIRTVNDNSASIYEVKIAKKFVQPIASRKFTFTGQSKSQNNLPGIVVLASSPEVKPQSQPYKDSNRTSYLNIYSSKPLSNP